ncbi:MAG: hypothetical protein OXN24_01580, partial [Candidatus Dadabacteria bacterium]|nr:hypothetical protein [Candidatus Dadabacteria bacterium]
DPNTDDNTATVTITDNDDGDPTTVPAAQFASAAYTAGEASGSRTASVVVNLSPAPSGPVDVSYTVAGTAAAPGDYAALLGTVRVGTSGTATISVTVADDSIDEADETVILTLTAGSGYSVGSTGVATVTITDDDDVPTVSLSVSSPVSESGAAVPVTAALSHASDTDVVLTVSSSGSAAALSTDKTLTIAAGQTASSGTVTLDPAGDSADTADREVTVSATVTGRGVSAPASVTVKITDDDATVVSLSGGGTVDEDGTPASAEVTVELGRALVAGETVEVPLEVSGAGVTAGDFTLALKTPAGSVNVGVTLAAAGTLAPRVKFADAGARTAVLVVAAAQDQIDEGASETATVAFGDLAANALATNVGGGAAASGTASSVTVTIADDDAAAPASLVVSETSVSVGEAGGQASFTVRLGSRPSAAVSVAVASAAAAATVSPATLTFAPGAWNAPQAVTVTGVDDDADNAGNKRDVTVTLDPSSSDAGYSALADRSVAVVVVDDDGAGVSVSQVAVSVSENGGTAVYQVRLGSRPSAAVTVTVTAPAGATAQPGSLVFQPAAWDAPQTVTVTGVDDGDDNPGDRRVVTVSHASSSSDSGYEATPVAPLTVTVVDDDGAGVTVSEAAVSVAEGGATDTYTVVLGSRPTHDVTVTVAAAAGATVNVSGGTAGTSQTLTFAPGDWNAPQTVTVAAADDDVDQPAGRTVSITHTAASDDPRYHETPVAPVAVAVADDDATSVSLSGGGTVS